MPVFESTPQHDTMPAESLGILLVNIGTPDAPTPTAVRRYLNQFLSDPRIVEMPRILWWFALHGFILRFRPARSAKGYQKIWTKRGSPLLLHSLEIGRALQSTLTARLTETAHIEIAMSYGNPSIEAALTKLHAGNATRIVVLPLYPQYSGSTTGSVFDAVTMALAKRRWVPEFRFINHYFDSAGYIAALAQSIRDHWQKQGRGERLLFSFHGLPMQMVNAGDPYYQQCHETATQVAAFLRLDDDEWSMGFQSRVGRGEWLQPHTDEMLGEWGRSGVGAIDVLCPGFAADCLETLEEIAIRYAAVYTEAGGRELRYIPALNARDDHISFLADLIETNVAGWKGSSATTNETAAKD